MLRTLKIKNFALIADQTLEFGSGFNVLVGETGAGKSLILDAISFVLGDKANKVNIRHGENKMSVWAVFDCDKAINDYLEENGIDVDDGLIINRSLTLDGKSDCRVNGAIVNVSFLKVLGELLADIYAQNENISLLSPKNHIVILDEYAKESVLEYKTKIASGLEELKILNENISKLGGNSENRDRNLELFDYQIKDITNVNPVVGEDEELKSKIDRLSNYEKIFDSIKDVTSNVSNVCDLLYECENGLTFVSKYDDSLSEITDRLRSSKFELQDILDTLKDYLGKSNFDAFELDNYIKRLDDLNSLKKKYGGSLQDVQNYLQKIKNEYDDLLFGEEKLKKLQEQKNKMCAGLYSLCEGLSNTRRLVAREIEQNVKNELSFLGFKNFKFSVKFEDLPKLDDAVFSKNGLDKLEFVFSANEGEEAKSLSKIVSGGEMSRFMLAIKNVFAKCNNTATLIFDEVDTGISGEIGLCVAKRLASLSKNSQLICITHLCQVASMADNYFFVDKYTQDGSTYTKVRQLEGDEIISYIAILSGAQPTKVALEFALELKRKADDYKMTLL